MIHNATYPVIALTRKPCVICRVPYLYSKNQNIPLLNIKIVLYLTCL